MLISKFKNSDMEGRVACMEEEYNILLPKQYRNFLCQYNGGYTPKTKFKVGKVSSDIRGFYGIGNVKLSFNNIELKGWIEKQLFPIACDSFGNYIVLGLGSENNGKIYFSNHEMGKKIDCIGENLKLFLDFCKSDKISDASRRSIREREEILIAKGRGEIITDSLRQMWQAEIDKYSSMIQEKVIIDET